MKTEELVGVALIGYAAFKLLGDKKSSDSAASVDTKAAEPAPQGDYNGNVGPFRGADSLPGTETEPEPTPSTGGSVAAMPVADLTTQDGTAPEPEQSSSLIQTALASTTGYERPLGSSQYYSPTEYARRRKITIA